MLIRRFASRRGRNKSSHSSGFLTDATSVATAMLHYLIKTLCSKSIGRTDAVEAPDRARIVKRAVERGAAAAAVGLQVERRRLVEEVEHRAVHREVLAEGIFCIQVDV